MPDSGAGPDVDELEPLLGRLRRALGDPGGGQHLATAGPTRDLLWTCNSPQTHDLLALRRGWTPERYGRWVADTLIASPLP